MPKYRILPLLATLCATPTVTNAAEITCSVMEVPAYAVQRMKFKIDEVLGQIAPGQTAHLQDGSLLSITVATGLLAGSTSPLIYRIEMTVSSADLSTKTRLRGVVAGVSDMNLLNENGINNTSVEVNCSQTR